MRALIVQGRYNEGGTVGHTCASVLAVNRSPGQEAPLVRQEAGGHSRICGGERAQAGVVAWTQLVQGGGPE